MGNIKMIETVCHGNTMHYAGTIVNLSNELEKHYLDNKLGVKVEEKESKVEATKVESKEEKIVYESKGKKRK
jgi:hypothetical protein